MALGIFCFFVSVVLGISFYLGAKAKSAKGYYAAHGQIHWFINGIAFAGDYLSAASFLGICGMIATSGYDGFLYSIGFLAGWVVALFVVAEPLKRLGRFTFADALDSRFNSRGIKLAAAISTLVVSIFYLIPQMVGAGQLIKPLLHLPHAAGVMIVGVVVIVIVATAGMVSTTYVQFIKGSMLVIFCTILVAMILQRGFKTNPAVGENKPHVFRMIPANEAPRELSAEVLPDEGPWKGKPFTRLKNRQTGEVTVWRQEAVGSPGSQTVALTETQTSVVRGDKTYINGREFKATDKPEDQPKLESVGQIWKLPDNKTETGPLGPFEFLTTLQNSTVAQAAVETVKDADGSMTKVYWQPLTKGSNLMYPGASGLFKGLRGDSIWSKLDFLSLMLALFCGTASLPHILIRYYTVKDQAAVRKSTVIGIASIGFFYVLTFFLGLGAMTSGTLDVVDVTEGGGNMAAPLLAKSFGEIPFAIISAIAFTTVLGTVSGLIMAASGAVAHDLMTNFLKMDLDDHAKVRAGKISAVFVGIIAMALGIIFEKMNVSFLVGWAFNVAASANLPALIMLLFWKGTTKQGITAAITVGMASSLTWILLSAQTFEKVYGMKGHPGFVPFTQPAIITIPLGFIVLIAVSMMTQKTGTAEAIAQQSAK